MTQSKFTVLFLLFILTFDICYSQDESADTSSVEEKNPDWKMKSIFGLNTTQSSFTNWAAGGRNNIAGLGFVNAQADYSKGRVKWANLLNMALGGIQYFDEGLQKTDDVFDFQSTFSYGSEKPWFLSALGGFRTQFIEGFSNPSDSLRSSTFLAPGYGNVSLGLEYIPNDNIRIMVSPLSGKFTLVRDERLANNGAFGVEGAEFDDEGNIITPGKMFRAEIGSYFRIIYAKEIMENIDLRTRIELFSNYINNPQNIDVNSELVMNFKINKWFSANLQAVLIYDDDIQITDRFGNTGPRTQFKQVIGLGISYRLANYKEKKKE